MIKFRIFGWRIVISKKPIKVMERKTRSLTRAKCRKLRLEKAGYRCEICGKPIDVRCSLHHLLPVGAENRNSVENVMALCSGCLHELEKRPHFHGLKHLEDVTRYDEEGN